MPNNFLCRIYFVTLTMLSASNAMSQDISFDFVQATFTSGTVDFDESIDEVEGSGIGLSLSLGFAPAFAFTLAVIETTFDTFHGISVDTAKVTTLGVTAYTAIKSGTDVFANLSALKAEILATNASGSVSEDDIGYMINIGLRHLVTESFEIEISAVHAFVFDDTDNSTKIDTRFYLRKRLSIGLGFITGDVVDSLFFNVRMDV